MGRFSTCFGLQPNTKHLILLEDNLHETFHDHFLLTPTEIDVVMRATYKEHAGLLHCALNNAHGEGDVPGNLDIDAADHPPVDNAHMA